MEDAAGVAVLHPGDQLVEDAEHLCGGQSGGVVLQMLVEVPALVK
jgi:hypothetical protein